MSLATRTLVVTRAEAPAGLIGDSAALAARCAGRRLRFDGGPSRTRHRPSRRCRCRFGERRSDCAGRASCRRVRAPIETGLCDRAARRPDGDDQPAGIDAAGHRPGRAVEGDLCDRPAARCAALRQARGVLRSDGRSDRDDRRVYRDDAAVRTCDRVRTARSRRFRAIRARTDGHACAVVDANDLRKAKVLGRSSGVCAASVEARCSTIRTETGTNRRRSWCSSGAAGERTPSCVATRVKLRCSDLLVWTPSACDRCGRGGIAARDVNSVRR